MSTRVANTYCTSKHGSNLERFTTTTVENLNLPERSEPASIDMEANFAAKLPRDTTVLGTSIAPCEDLVFYA